MDAFLVATSHMRVLKYDIRGETMTMSDTVGIAPGPVTGWGQNEGMCLLKWDWLVETEPDDQPFLRVRACLRICDLARRLEVIFVGWLFSHSEASFIAVQYHCIIMGGLSTICHCLCHLPAYNRARVLRTRSLN